MDLGPVVGLSLGMKGGRLGFMGVRLLALKDKINWDDKLEKVETRGLHGFAVTMMGASIEDTGGEESNTVTGTRLETMEAIEVVCEVKEETDSINGIWSLSNKTCEI